MIVILMTTFLYGLIVGSFLNAWIWRVRTDRNIARGRSMCPHCKHTLVWYDLIPMLSWLILRGKCRYCKRPISVQYPLVELTTGITWIALVYAFYPWTLYGWLELAIWLTVSALMIAAFVYDARWMLLPDQFTIPAIMLAALWLIVRWVGFGESAMAYQQLLSTALFSGAFFLLWFVSGGRWLGDGDIRLAVLMGLLLNPTQLIVAIFFSFNLGAIVGIFIVLRRGVRKGTAIPFGPFLIISTFIGLFFGQYLVDAYLKLLI